MQILLRPGYPDGRRIPAVPAIPGSEWIHELAESLLYVLRGDKKCQENVWRGAYWTIPLLHKLFICLVHDQLYRRRVALAQLRIFFEDRMCSPFIVVNFREIKASTKI